MLSQKQKSQAYLIKGIIQSTGWKAYEEFIKDFIYDYLNSHLSKETLGGIKLALTEAKSLVEKFELES